MIFITTALNDIHAGAVWIALKTLDYPVTRWITTDFPSEQQLTIELGEGSSLFTDGTDVSFDVPIPLRHSVLWNRRIVTRPRVSPDLHRGDEGMATRESMFFIDNVVSLLSTCPRRVNDVYAARRAENKALQLYLAKRVGFSIPRTLITNCPRQVRAFLKEVGGGEFVVKPFRPAVWRTPSQDFVTHTAMIDGDMLPSDHMLMACPAIYQQYVAKAFEVRITCIGGELVAVKLDSQAYAESRIDWRSVSPSLLAVEPIKLPGHVELRCRALLKELGLSFGCIDAIVTPDGKWVFLEINQMGQFLWIEEVNRDVRLLEKFVTWLISDDENKSTTKPPSIDFDLVMLEAYKALENERPSRASRNVTNIYDG